MAATGIGFAALVSFWPLLVIAVVGTLNPSAGAVSVFLPTEQAYVAGEVEAPDRPRLFARYNLAAICAGALGAGGWLAVATIDPPGDFDMGAPVGASRANRVPAC